MLILQSLCLCTMLLVSDKVHPRPVLHRQLSKQHNQWCALLAVIRCLSSSTSAHYKSSLSATNYYACS